MLRSAPSLPLLHFLSFTSIPPLHSGHMIKGKQYEMDDGDAENVEYLNPALFVFSPFLPSDNFIRNETKDNTSEMLMLMLMMRKCIVVMLSCTVFAFFLFHLKGNDNHLISSPHLFRSKG